MRQKTFNELTDCWLAIAANFAIKNELKAHIDNKFELSKKIYEYLCPVISRLNETVLGQTDQHYGKNLSYGLNINRLLKSKSIDIVNPQSAENLTELIMETFSFGILTQLYLFHFPTREKYSFVELYKLEKEWIVDAVAADYVMGYYGDKQNPICINILDLQFKEKIRRLLKHEFKINIFRMGSFRSFFRNLYIAGALLAMNCDRATKKV